MRAKNAYGVLMGDEHTAPGDLGCTASANDPEFAQPLRERWGDAKSDPIRLRGDTEQLFKLDEPMW